MLPATLRWLRIPTNVRIAGTPVSTPDKDFARSPLSILRHPGDVTHTLFGWSTCECAIRRAHGALPYTLASNDI